MPIKTAHKSADLLCACAQLGCRGAELCGFGGGVSRPLLVRSVRRGESLPVRDNARMRFHIVRQGLVATCVVMPDGRRQILSLNFPGDVVCPVSAEGAECWCEALTQSEVCELDLSAGGEKLQGDPAFSRTLFRLAHDRLARATAHLVALGRFDGMERACGFLAYMTRRLGRRNGTGWRTNLPMSREDIADYLGLNPDTAGRLLMRIRKAGLVHFRSPTEFEVPCLERLEARVPIALAQDFGTPRRAGKELAS